MNEESVDKELTQEDYASMSICDLFVELAKANDELVMALREHFPEAYKIIDEKTKGDE